MDPKQMTFRAHIKAKSYDYTKLVKYWNKFKLRIDLDQKGIIESCLRSKKTLFADFVNNKKKIKFKLDNSKESAQLLFCVMSNGDIEAIKWIEKNMGNFKFEDHLSLLLKATDLNGIKWLLSKVDNTKLYTTNIVYNSFLHACNYRRVGIAKYIVERSIDNNKLIDISKNNYECLYTFKTNPKNKFKDLYLFIKEISEKYDLPRIDTCEINNNIKESLRKNGCKLNFDLFRTEIKTQ